MPRAKKESRKKMSVEVDRQKMMFLLNHNLDLVFEKRPELARRAWELWRAKIMPVWVDVLPGCRCWAWWKYEAKEQRRAVCGTVDIYTRRPDIKKRNYAFGCPTAYDYTKDGEPIETDFEPECDYLARLDLLTDAEKTLPLKTLRANSCDYIKRYELDLKPVEAILTRLGFDLE